MHPELTTYLIQAGSLVLLACITFGTTIYLLRRRAKATSLRNITEFYNNDCGKIDAPTCAGRGVLPREYKVVVYETKGPADIGSARRICILGYSIVTALQDHYMKLTKQFPLATIKPLQLIYAQDFIKPHPCQ